jgi:hypothetical protein
MGADEWGGEVACMSQQPATHPTGLMVALAPFEASNAADRSLSQEVREAEIILQRG